MKVLLGKKLGMLQQFTETGAAVGVTVIEALPATVLRLRSEEKDGYAAMQVGAREKLRAGKAATGQGNGTAYQVVREFPVVSDDIKPGSTLGLEQFEEGEKVHVSAVSKGKGFQGTIKRHNFSRGPMTHGSRNQRLPGSIGGTDAARVFPGQKMAGRMGAAKVTTKNLVVTAIHPDDNVILLRGSVPGPNGVIVTVRTV